MDDGAEIDQLRAAVADLERLRADTLQLLHESGELLERIERINTPLMGFQTKADYEPQYGSLLRPGSRPLNK